MQVILNSIDGIADAIEAMFFSKRNWNLAIHNTIREECLKEEKSEQFYKWLDIVCRMTKKHITIGKFIDLSFIVIGLHRGGQDDWDAHAKRFDNRIIRNSTRLSNYGNEKSDWYKDKILTTDEVLNLLNIKSPNEIEYNGKIYIKTINGYIQKEYQNDKDVKRGLYMLSIPSDFIFRINLTEFSHIYKERNELGTANPEVKQCAEMCLNEINKIYPQFNKELMMAIQN